MAELLAAFGFTAKSLFDYNRESFKFDQGQRLERESMRLKMQVKRFELFREDVRDLVSLTVGRMDVYHLVGALFLMFCVVLFCEGRIEAEAPPFLLALFLMSNACAFVYLMLAVWLSMHASIASHSFGARILTRFLRLPIPSSCQIQNLSSRLAAFEFQDWKDLMRVPFQGVPQRWEFPRHTSQGSNEDAKSSESGSGAGAATRESNSSSSAALPAVPLAASACKVSKADSVRSNQTAKGEASRQRPRPRPSPLELQSSAEDNEAKRLLERGDSSSAQMGEEFLLRSGLAPGQHILLLRHVQAKWQSYDAYCRVCMALGVNQILQGLSYWCICHTLLEHRTPSLALGFTMLFAFQIAALALSVLDISGVRRWVVVAVQGVGAVPAVLAAANVAYEVHRHLHPVSKLIMQQQPPAYPAAPFMFILEACWFDLLLWMASPSASDEAKLPRRFRAVLFMDVFGDAHDPTEAEFRVQTTLQGAFHSIRRRNSVVLPNPFTPAYGGGTKLPTTEEEDFLGEAGNFAIEVLVAERVIAAEEALNIARLAILRWGAVPQQWLSTKQAQELKSLRKNVTLWRRAFRTDQAWRQARRGLPHEQTMTYGDEDGLRGWGEMDQRSNRDDPFAHSLIGPLENDTGYDVTMYFFDVEKKECVWDEVDKKSRVLTLEAVAAVARGFEASVRTLLEMEDDLDMEDGEEVQEEEEKFLEAYCRVVYDRVDFVVKAVAMQAYSLVVGTVMCVRRLRRRLRPFVVQETELEATDAEPSFLPRQGLHQSYSYEAEIVAYPHLHRVPSNGHSPSPLSFIPSTPRSFMTNSASLLSTFGAGDESSSPQRPRLRRQTTLHLPGVSAPTWTRKAGHQQIAPARLPWVVLSCITRLLQVGWFFAGFMHTKDLDQPFHHRSGNKHHGSSSHTYRRLREQVASGFVEVDIDWPHGPFFQPRSIGCLQSGQVIMSSLYQSYLLEEDVSAPSAWRWVAMAHEHRKAFCQMHSTQRTINEVGCLFGHVSGDKLHLWRSMARTSRSEKPDATLRVEGKPWLHVTGALWECADLEALYTPGLTSQCPTAGISSGVCLVLAGWDGSKLLGTVTPLYQAADDLILPCSNATLKPRFELPMPSAEVWTKPSILQQAPSCAATSIDLDARSLRLWALLDCSGSNTSHVRLWSLLSAGTSSQWQLQTNDVPDFQAIGLCESPSMDRLVVVGRGKHLNADSTLEALPMLLVSASSRTR